MRQSTTSASISNVNYLEFQCGDANLKVPESVMTNEFKTAMGTMAGMAIGTVAILFGYELIKIINKEVIAHPTYYVQQPTIPYYYPQNNVLS